MCLGSEAHDSSNLFRQPLIINQDAMPFGLCFGAVLSNAVRLLTWQLDEGMLEVSCP